MADTELRTTRRVASPALAAGLVAAVVAVYVYPIGWAAPYGAPVFFIVFHGMFWPAVAVDAWQLRKRR